MDCNYTLKELISSWRKDRFNFYSEENQQKMLDFDTDCSTAKAQLIQEFVQNVSSTISTINGINSETISRKNLTNNDNEWSSLIIEKLIDGLTLETLTGIIISGREMDEVKKAEILVSLKILEKNLISKDISSKEFFEELDKLVDYLSKL